MSTNQSAVQYTVWVGGIEVNDFLLTKEQAEKVSNKFLADGYHDVVIELVEEK